MSDYHSQEREKRAARYKKANKFLESIFQYETIVISKHELREALAEFFEKEKA